MISSTPAWPNSSIKVQSVLSLNEIINIPQEFVSRHPHYVVSNTDWHQCRYLFVSSASSRPSYPHAVAQLSIPPNPILPPGLQSNAPLQAGTQLQNNGQGSAAVQSAVAMLAQDPLYEVKGPNGQTLQIPVASMPVRTGNVGQGGMLTTPSKVIRILDEESDEESAEDQELLADDGTMPDEEVALGRHGKRPRPSSSMETILAPDK
jgi:ubiquitin-conjugating enzyme E2 Q